MAENRTHPRLNVTWNAAIRLPSKQIIQVKVINVSAGGLQFSCSENLRVGVKYEMQMYVPELNGSGNTVIVPVFADCLYVILSGNGFRIGARFSGLNAKHAELLGKWAERASRGAA